MQGISNYTPAQARKACPYLRMMSPESAAKAMGQETPAAQTTSRDSVSITPFEPVPSKPLSKTCVSAAAKTAMGLLPGVAKAGCPHAS